MPEAPRKLVALCLWVAISATVLLRLFWPPEVGLANNGDFIRTICHVKAGQTLNASQVFVHTVFTYPRQQGSVSCDLVSSELVFTYPAALVSRALPGHPAIDLRVVAGFHALAFGAVLTGLALALTTRRRDAVLLGGLFALVVADTATVIYFMSGYDEPSSAIFLVGFAACAAASWRRRHMGWTAATLAMGLLLLWSKPQHAPLVVVLAPVVAVLAWRAVDGGGLSRLLLPLTAGLVLVGAAIGCVALEPAVMSHDSRYDAVFFDLLGHSSNPAADLRSLGLPSDLAPLAGTNAYDRPRTSAAPTALPQVAYPQLARYYLERPSRTMSLLARAMRASLARPAYLGNYAVGQGPEPNAYALCGARCIYQMFEPVGLGASSVQLACRVCVMSWIAREVTPAGAVVVPLLWLAGAAAALSAFRRRRRELGLTLAALVAIAVVTLVVAAIGEGGYEMTKHLYLVWVDDLLVLSLTVFEVWSIFEPRLSRHGRSVAPARA